MDRLMEIYRQVDGLRRQLMSELITSEVIQKLKRLGAMGPRELDAQGSGEGVFGTGSDRYR